MSLHLIGSQFHNQMHHIGGGWGNQFGSCCGNVLGARRAKRGGALAGTLLGGFMGALIGGGPIGGLIGMGIGGLLGGKFGNAFANHRNPHHMGAACYPPSAGHHFGGPQYGGYSMPGNFGHGQFGMPHWCPPGNQFNGPVNFNFNYGHQCPPSRCCPPNPCCGRPQGQLKQEKDGKPIQYTTSGGYTVEINKHTIKVTDPSGKNELKHWGDPHENLNGKHLKDWEGKQRSIVLGDGTKLTMTAEGPHGVTLNTSIYDGNQNIQIDNAKNSVYHHSLNPFDTMYREMSQHDGETATFLTDWNGAAHYNNIYTQDDNFGINYQYTPLGMTGGFSNPGKVHDYYDDPRIAHT